MRRPWWFWTGLPVAGRLQAFAFGLILAYNFATIDINPQNRFFGQPLWHFTVPLMVGSVVISRLLLPLMMAYPQRTQQLLHALGLVTFGVWLFSRRLTPFLYFGLAGSMWFEAASLFWFVSEIKRREALLLTGLIGLREQMDATQEDEPIPPDEEDDPRDNRFAERDPLRRGGDPHWPDDPYERDHRR